MGLNFYGYDCLQPKTTPPKTYQPAVYTGTCVVPVKKLQSKFQTINKTED